MTSLQAIALAVAIDDLGDNRRDLTLAFVQSLLDVSLIMGMTAVSQMTRADRRLRPSGATAGQIGDRGLINYTNCVVGLWLTQWNALLRYMHVYPSTGAPFARLGRLAIRYLDS